MQFPNHSQGKNMYLHKYFKSPLSIATKRKTHYLALHAFVKSISFFLFASTGYRFRSPPPETEAIWIGNWAGRKLSLLFLLSLFSGETHNREPIFKGSGVEQRTLHSFHLDLVHCPETT